MNEGNLEHSGLSLRERNRLRLRQRILDAAAVLFRVVGYEQATMDAIAEEAEVSRGTLFNYFPTKQALLLPFAYELYTQKVQPDVLAYLESDSPGIIEVLRVLFLRIQDAILTFPGIDKALQAELFQSHAKQEEDTQREAGFLGTITMILYYGQNRGEVRTDIPVENLARNVGILYISLLHTVLVRTTRESSLDEHYQQEVELLLAFLNSALHPEPGFNEQIS